MSEESDSDKAGVTTADKIQRWIRDEGWPVGMHLGTEPQLMEQFAVSRGILREALRMLEQRGAVETRRGRGGGTRVARPSSAAVVEAATPYLQYRGVKPSQLLEARRTLEIAVVPLVVDRMNNENARALRRYITQESASSRFGQIPPQAGKVSFSGFHTALASVSGNPALELFSHILEALVFTAYSKRQAERGMGLSNVTIHNHHRVIVESLIAKNEAQALQGLSDVIELTRDLYEDDASSPDDPATTTL